MSRKLYALVEVNVLEEDAARCSLDCPKLDWAGDPPKPVPQPGTRWHCRRYDIARLGNPPRRCAECIEEAMELVEVDDRETDEPALMQTQPGDRVVTLRRSA